MTKQEVLEILFQSGRCVTPDVVCRQLRGFHHRSSVYSYLFRLHKKGLLQRQTVHGRIAYQISQRGIGDCISSSLESSRSRRASMIHQSEWLTAMEGVAYLKVKVRTLLLWVRRGKVKGYALSGTQHRVWRFQQCDLDAMLTEPSVALESKRRIR